MHPRKDALLAKLKLLSVKPNGEEQTSYDLITEFALDKVIDDVAAYTHIVADDLPIELDNTLISMALNAIAENGLLSSVSSDDGAVSSVSEGDSSVNFMSPLDAYKTLNEGSTLTTNYLAILNTFRMVAK